METATFATLREIIYRESGIALDNNKLSLLSNRLYKRLRALGIADENEYLALLEADSSGSELSRLVDAVSTNHTYFYREEEHFKILQDILRKEYQTAPTFRLWCAAASSGEEPYTLAITVNETLDCRRYDAKILATDICTDVLERAVQGQYSESHMERIPLALKEKYFTAAPTAKGDVWSVSTELRNLVAFRRLNLVRFPYPLKGPIDIIFCRNVMIYFDLPTRTKVITEMYRLLKPGGYLFLSMSENLLGIAHTFEKFSACVYRKPGGG